jgi:hypothetical protein
MSLSNPEKVLGRLSDREDIAYLGIGDNSSHVEASSDLSLPSKLENAAPLLGRRDFGAISRAEQQLS